jgi:hypothetical protein
VILVFFLFVFCTGFSLPPILRSRL